MQAGVHFGRPDMCRKHRTQAQTWPHGKAGWRLPIPTAAKATARLRCNWRSSQAGMTPVKHHGRFACDAPSCAHPPGATICLSPERGLNPLDGKRLPLSDAGTNWGMNASLCTFRPLGCAQSHGGV